MSGTRPRTGGSFAGDLGELIKHFPSERRPERPEDTKRRTSQESRDIHRLLFERAWRIDGEG